MVRIYNYIELREELKKKGFQFRTNSDTEVVIKAYEAWGYDYQNKNVERDNSSFIWRLMMLNKTLI